MDMTCICGCETGGLFWWDGVRLRMEKWHVLAEPWCQGVLPGGVATAGAPVPPGADAVVQVEDTEKLPDGEGSQRRVRICKAAKAGQDIRPVGSDIT